MWQFWVLFLQIVSRTSITSTKLRSLLYLQFQQLLEASKSGSLWMKVLKFSLKQKEKKNWTKLQSQKRPRVQKLSPTYMYYSKRLPVTVSISFPAWKRSTTRTPKVEFWASAWNQRTGGSNQPLKRKQTSEVQSEIIRTLFAEVEFKVQNFLKCANRRRIEFNYNHSRASSRSIQRQTAAAASLNDL